MPQQQEPAHNLYQKLREPLWTRPFIVLTTAYFLLFLCLQMLLSPFPSYVKDRFAPNDFTLSLVTSLFALTAIATRFAAAALMRRISRASLLYIGVIIAAAATAAYPLAGTVAAVLFLRICFGVGFGIGSTVMPTFVSRIIPRERMGEGIGYFGLSTSLAMSLGPMIGLSVLRDYGFPTLAVMGTVSVLAILPLLILTRSMPTEAILPAESGKKGRSPVPPGNDTSLPGKKGFMKKLLLPALLNMLLSGCYGGILSFIALYGKEIGLDNIGLFFLFNAVTVLAVRPLSGKLYDAKGHAVILIPAAGVLVVSLLLLSFAESMPPIIASALLFGLGYGAIQPTIQAWMLGGMPLEKHGTINSLFYNTLDFGVAFGSMLLGAIAASTGYAVMYRYSAGMMIIFLLLYIGASFGVFGNASTNERKDIQSIP